MYSIGRAPTISSYFVLEAVMPRPENCTSACTNQILGIAGQNRDSRIATAAMVVGGSSNDMSVTVRIMSRKKNLIIVVHLLRVTNCSF